MTLLNPTFDVHLRKINKLKVSAFAATEKAKRILSTFFKANDYVYTFDESRIKELLKYCLSKKLTVHIDESIRHRDKRSKD